MSSAEIAALVLPIALGVVMMGAGGVNVAGPPPVRKSFARWGYPAGFHRVVGGVEIATGLLLLIPATSQAGAVASTVILTAAVATVVRFRDWMHLPGAIALAAAAAAVIHW